ncbi:hypothetical protein A7981_00720 [Methylovorus sp. MM2]|uniref:hypothetical protein n=1 Tax=Methylovorus sp. MM2 TaxID=1848038 RepID=UPI0007E10A8B|nr:hypothetical protein [Methylovorus sp. MM2]OAM52049.1 hypothetical protein A7981_00720 [Methylovorus sp. MM2]
MQPLSKVEGFFTSQSYAIPHLATLHTSPVKINARVNSNQFDQQAQEERSQLVKMLADCGDCI